MPPPSQYWGPPTKCSTSSSGHACDSDDDEQEILCDSLIAKPGILRGSEKQSHMEFVTFAPDQAYPEYILRFVEEED